MCPTMTIVLPCFLFMQILTRTEHDCTALSSWSLYSCLVCVIVMFRLRVNASVIINDRCLLDLVKCV